MRGLRSLLLILLAAVFVGGGPLRAPSAAPAATAPPCPMMTNIGMAMGEHDKAPARKSKPDLMAMSCCSGCLPAVARDAASSLGPAAVLRVVFAPLHETIDGQSPAPEQGPPRPFA